MKNICFLLITAELLLGASAFAASPEIKLSGRKDSVLSSQMRTVVLEVAQSCLNRENDAFTSQIAELDSPYAIEEEGAEAIATEASEPELIAAPVVYDDASILQAIGDTFAKQISGTLARGTTHYIQLEGGGMLKNGTSFPATVPQVEGKAFTVTIVDITSSSYTLKMRDATLVIPLEAPSERSSGAVKSSMQ